MKPIAVKIGPFGNSGDSIITTSLTFHLSFFCRVLLLAEENKQDGNNAFSTFPSVEKLIIAKRSGYLLDIKPRYVVTQTIKRNFRIQ